MLLALALNVALAAGPEVTLPRGWRRPAAVDVAICVGKGADPYRVVADFDGDGQTDEARLLIKNSGHTLGLWIWRGDQAPFLLDHWSGVADGAHTMAIGLVPGPGKSKTWCGKGDDCAPGEPAVIKWANPSLTVIWCERHADVIYWDTGRGKFRTVVVSD